MHARCAGSYWLFLVRCEEPPEVAMIGTMHSIADRLRAKTFPLRFGDRVT